MQRLALLIGAVIFTLIVIKAELRLSAIDFKILWFFQP